MLDALVKQAQRLFSSKRNGGKQVPKLTDQLHTYKLVIIALSMIILVGYAQFREHIKCMGYGDFDEKTATNFCLMNGTTTVISSAANKSQTNPHVGIGFPTTKGDKVISHNYMRDYWFLLILLAICSHMAQRKWATLFNNHVLQGLLQLVGCNELRQVRAAESAKPYELLSGLSSDLTQELKRQAADDQDSEMSRNELVVRRLELVDAYVNIYDHALDYYPNQLTYLLLTKNTASFKLSSLKLRRQLITHALVSTALAGLQLGLPLVFLGNEYLPYGWRYLAAVIAYLADQLTGNSTSRVNSIDYELSATLFPINTACECRQYGSTGSPETLVFQCTLAINEISAKLFVIIWWFVVVSLVIELCSLLAILFSSLNSRTIRCAFGLRFWPRAREQADLIARFRHKRAILLRRQKLIKQLSHGPALQSKINLTSKPSQILQPVGDSPDEQLRKKKKLAGDLSYGFDDNGGSLDGASKKWYMWCPRDLCVATRRLGVKLVCCYTERRRGQLDREATRDINIYYLLYLIHLRLGGSRSKTEEVIRMTSGALSNYLTELEGQCDDLRQADEDNDREVDANTDDYNSLDRDDPAIKMS